jgi:hypothetical protein
MAAGTTLLLAASSFSKLGGLYRWLRALRALRAALTAWLRAA